MPISLHQEMQKRTPGKIYNSAIFQYCQPSKVVEESEKKKKQTVELMLNELETITNEHQMNCNCIFINSVKEEQKRCSNRKCKAVYHQNCPQSQNDLCVKCTLTIQRNNSIINNNNYDDNILYRLIFKAHVLIQCVVRFLSFTEYTLLRITSKILYQETTNGKARSGVHSFDICEFDGLVYNFLSNIEKKKKILQILYYFKKSLRNVTIKLWSISKKMYKTSSW